MPGTALRHLCAGAAVAAVAGLAGPAGAAPRVAVDIAPVHSIAAAVMAGVGEPDLVVPPGASPHGYALRPSEAAALEAAELVVWIGPSLTPWLAGPLGALAGTAPRLTLEDAAGVRLLDIREGGPFEAHDHGHDLADHGHEDGHADDHAEAGGDHAGEAAHDHDHEPDHGHDEAAGHEHDHEHDAAHAVSGDARHDEDGAHGLVDAHLWLDPMNAAAIASAIATALGDVDAENAAAYAANAAGFAAEMNALAEEVGGLLAPLRGRTYFVFHDAYQYFEDRFDFRAAGSVALSDAEPPRAPRVAQIRERFETEAIDCVFAEPQFEPRLIGTLIEGTSTRTGALDPLGADLEPGAGLYPALIRNLAADLAACLEPDA